MSGFSPEWLALREPFDAAARSAALVAELRSHLPIGTGAAPLEIVDLGAGAGSNLRYLAPLLGGAQRWRLIDHDPKLLDAAVAATLEWAAACGARGERRGTVVRIQGDGFAAELSCEHRDLRTLAALDVPPRGLVTAAALLDLVSAEWLDALAARCVEARASLLFALTYEGRTACTPPDAEDATVLALFNRHQRSDKGFGPALGPDAARAAEAAFRKHGYSVSLSSSDWQIGPDAAAMQHALLDGWLGAAVEMAPERHAALASWHERRRALVAAGRSALRVGHLDLVGTLSR
jgi:hypothetical protein